MGRPDDVDSDSYTSACSEFYYANHAIIDKVGNLGGRLASSGAMAGSDAGGQEWAKQYDAVSGPLVQAGADIGESMGQMANLLNASLKNHRGAEYGAQLDGPPQYQTSTDDGDADPDHWVETLSPGSLPSVSGGTGDNPDLWHWLVDHMEGFLWPDADTGKMRSAGQAWISAGQTLTSYSYNVDAAKSTIATLKCLRSATRWQPARTSRTCNGSRRCLRPARHGVQRLGQACRRPPQDDRGRAGLLPRVDSRDRDRRGDRDRDGKNRGRDDRQALDQGQ